MVGLIPLFAVEVLEPGAVARNCPNSPPGWNGILNHRPDLANLVSRWHECGDGRTPACFRCCAVIA